MEKESVLKVSQVDINSVKPYYRNSRKNENTINVVAESISQFGFQQPIVVDKDNTIVAGHSRWHAAKQLKLSDVPVIVFNGSDEQARYYRILDNRSQENSDWDYDLLKSELLDIDQMYPTGFSDNELAKLLNETTSIKELADKTVFELVVSCESESQQQELYDYITKEVGKKCRVLSI